MTIKGGALAGRWLEVRLNGFTTTKHVRIAIRQNGHIVGHRIVIRHFAKVAITLVNKQGKIIGHRTKLVQTGHVVRVMRIGKAVHSVRVSPLSV